MKTSRELTQEVENKKLMDSSQEGSVSFLKKLANRFPQDRRRELAVLRFLVAPRRGERSAASRDMVLVAVQGVLARYMRLSRAREHTILIWCLVLQVVGS